MGLFSKFVRTVNKVNKVVKDVDAVMSADPKKITKRAKNKLKAKALTKSGFWKW